MHVIWFYMILRVAFKSAVTGKVDKDDRSESDNDSEYQAELDTDKRENKKKAH